MNRLNHKIAILILFVWGMSLLQAYAQVPGGYYKMAEGKKGHILKTALFHSIKNPRVISYSALWGAFKRTDMRPDGRVWDIYSTQEGGKAPYSFDFDTNRCGRYHREGDCYNREHSVPKSWFKEAPPMFSDLFHVYPTDGYVNGRRGNLPYGEVGITSWVSANGSKVGQNTFGGYTKRVFEPIDEYKGDLARTYFYMATAYEDKLSNWKSDQIGGNRYPGFSQWSLELLLKWHREDPVSEKEIRRNEAVYAIQQNRNPYIDYPELAEYVWGKRKEQSFSFSKAKNANTRQGDDSVRRPSPPLKMAVITDTHYLSSALSIGGPALEAYQNATGRNVADLHAVFDDVLTDIEREQTDILLICGDITNHGERRSHLDFIGKIRPLQKKGMRVFVIPGNHDIAVPDAKAYIGNAATVTESITPDEFAQLYASFGYASALKRDPASLSYLAEINEHTWLLCFDTNRYREQTTSSITSGRIHPETLQWAFRILDEAKQKGITVLGMMHHGLVEHMPYQAVFFGDYLVDGWQDAAQQLADRGLKVVFTGHFHSNDVSSFTSSAGNTLYDVETASLSQYPFAYRFVELHQDRLSIDTRFVDSIPGKPFLQKEYKSKFEKLSRRVAANRLKQIGFPLPQETLDALTELLVKMAVLHAAGDEKTDAEMTKAVETLQHILGGENAGIESFQMDFPPADNRLVIAL